MRLLLVTTAVTVACQSATDQGATDVRERWYHTQPGWSWARPAIAGNVVFFGTGDGHIIARDVNTGRPVWVATVGTQQVNGANLLVADGVLVVPVVSYTVGLDVATGREVWRYPAPPDTIGRPPGTAQPGQVVLSWIDNDDQSVFIPAWGASVSAVDVRTGAVRWIWQPGRFPSDTAASGVFRSGSMGVRVSGDTVFATVWHHTNPLGGSSEAWVVAIDRYGGEEHWRTRLPDPGSGVMIGTPPALYRDVLIVRTLHARVYAIDRATQKVVWQFSPPAARLSTVSPPEAFGDIVYVDGGDEHLYALRAGTGDIVWQSPFPSQVGRGLLVTARRITFGTDRELFVVDRETGRRVATTTQPRTHDPLFSSPAQFANGLIFVTVGGGAWCFEEP